MKKLTSIHYLRAFSMLFIVGYWHLFDYSSASLGHSSPVMITIAHLVLALFVFMSGFLLATKSTESMSTMQFYKRRLLRIYPLYALAVGVFLLYGINDGWTSVKALFGVSMFAEPAPLTLWFVTMLVLFYLMTPLLLSLVGRVWQFVAFAFSFVAAAIFVQFLFGSVDPKVILYFPSFCLGIYCAHYGVKSSPVNPLTASLAWLAAIGLSFIAFPIETLSYLVESVLVAAGAYLVFYVSLHNEKRLPSLAVVGFLSYSSFAMYLFHRPVFTTLQAVYFPENALMQVVYLLTVGLAIVAAVAYCLQRGYDALYNTLYSRPAISGTSAVAARRPASTE